jgi:Holliday junction resolvase YEN1
VRRLYDVIGEGDVHSLADYAARHWQQHKRPLRIAVDEACWRFTNLTPEQVQKIREGEPAANPVEKVILWRILRLLKLNVQLLFVNDGARRPWKRNKRGGGKLDYELTRLTRKLLQHLKVPHHDAPGEAEAECARLQALGVVDAVWSDDSDTLMFGCGTLIRQHKTGNARVKDHIRVYQAKAIQDKYDLDADGLVLFAVIAGGDYNTEGLPGCGSKTAALLAKRSVGLSQALRNTSQPTLPAWRSRLEQALILHRKAIEVPLGFPEWRALNYYRNPTVSTTEQLLNLRGLKNGWETPMDQRKLRIFLCERFHFTTREFLKHIAPIYLTRRLVQVGPEQRDQNLELGIQLKRTKKKNDEDDIDARTEAKVTFSPLPVVEIDLSQQPPEEDWTKFAAKDRTPYDPTQSVECELLRCFLSHGLPDGALEYAKPAKRKRNERNPTSASSTPSKKQKVDSNTKRCKSVENIDSVAHSEDSRNSTKITPKKRGRPKKQRSGGPKESTKATAMKKDEAVPDDPPPAVFQQSRALLDLRASILNEHDYDSNGFASPIEQQPVGPTPPLLDTLVPRNRPPVLPKPRMVPGEAISPETLRKLRAAAFLPISQNGRPPGLPPQTNAQPTFQSKRTAYEVIDLT